jgi:simple sugar transport system ATP-binding protein
MRWWAPRSRYAGTVHALLGENGAGKTTLMRIAYGMIRPDHGVIRIDGRVIRIGSPRDAIAAGLGMVHQHFTIVQAMTVAENVGLGGRGRFRPHVVAERIRALGIATGMTLDPEAPASSLGVGAQQQLEIIKALAHDVKILILDEPTAVLAPVEAEQLMRRLRKLADDGLSVVLITHKLREALAIVDDVTVLRGGRTVLAASADSVTEPELASSMLGSDWTDSPGNPVIHWTSTPTSSGSAAKPSVVRAAEISVRDERGVLRVRGASLEISAGEIVGIAGVEGSGVHELLRALAGRIPLAAGTLKRPSSVAFVPQDRHREALVLDFSLTENVALRGAGQRYGMMPWAQLREKTLALLGEFDIRAATVDDPVGVLSGGNQQKLVFAREIGEAPALLIVENPTRGLDLRASAAVHDRLRIARDAGMSVVVHSSDLEEILAFADRTFAMHAGVLVETAPTREAMGRAMLGAAPEVREPAIGE